MHVAGIAYNLWGHRSEEHDTRLAEGAPEGGARTHLTATGVRGQAATAIRAARPLGVAASLRSLCVDTTHCSPLSLGRRGIALGLSRPHSGDQKLLRSCRLVSRVLGRPDTAPKGTPEQSPDDGGHQCGVGVFWTAASISR